MCDSALGWWFLNASHAAIFALIGLVCWYIRKGRQQLKAQQDLLAFYTRTFTERAETLQQACGRINELEGRLRQLEPPSC